MSGPDEDREALEKFVASQGRKRRLSGVFLCGFGVAMIALHAWGISSSLHLARQHDELVGTLAEVHPTAVAEAAPFQMAAHTALNIALSVANGLVGVFLVVFGVVYLVRTPATRALEALASRAISRE